MKRLRRIEPLRWAAGCGGRLRCRGGQGMPPIPKHQVAPEVDRQALAAA